MYICREMQILIKLKKEREMKKITFVIMAMVALTFASCGNKTNAGAGSDTTSVDTAVVDTLAVDTLAIDTLAL